MDDQPIIEAAKEKVPTTFDMLPLSERMVSVSATEVPMEMFRKAVLALEHLEHMHALRDVCAPGSRWALQNRAYVARFGSPVQPAGIERTIRFDRTLLSKPEDREAMEREVEEFIAGRTGKQVDQPTWPSFRPSLIKKIEDLDALTKYELAEYILALWPEVNWAMDDGQREVFPDRGDLLEIARNRFMDAGYGSAPLRRSFRLQADKTEQHGE